MKKASLEEQRNRLERRLFNAKYIEMHRDSMRKAYADAATVKMHEFRGGRTVSIQLYQIVYQIVFWNGNDHSFIDNTFSTEEKAVKFVRNICGNIGWNIK